MLTRGTLWTVAVLATAWGIGAPVAATTPGLAPIAVLTVSSDPVGATVYVDGRVVGRTPLDVPALPAGDHRVRLVRDGYLEHSRVVKIGRDKSETLHVRLTRAALSAARQSGGLRIVVIEGEGAVNIIQQKTAVAPVVEVRDRNNLPVSGALVTFTIAGGKSAAFAGGAQTLTVTTNAAGRAAAAALNPLSSGSVQIQVQAAFQGQTAAATIAQTNVMTAAQAAHVAAGAGGAGGIAAGGAAGGGGGLSGTTIGIIAAAVGGGALVATKVVGGGGAQDTTYTVYTGSFTGQMVFSQSFGPLSTCDSTRALSGTLTMTLEGTAKRTLQITGTESEIAFTASPFCSSWGSAGLGFGGDVTGTPAALAFAQERSFTSTGPPATVTSTTGFSFAGALNSGVVTGTLTYTETTAGVGQFGNVFSGRGSTTMSVLLR